MVRAETTSAAILEAARRVVATHGPRRLTLSAVALEAGVSRPTLYRRFPSKEVLLATLTLDSVERFDRGLRETVAGRKAPEERLHAMLRHIVRYLDDNVGVAPVHADADFTLQSLADTVTSHAELLGDALECLPGVAAGHLTRSQATDLMLRVAYSHYLVPHPDPDELLAALTGLAGLRRARSPGRTSARRRP